MTTALNTAITTALFAVPGMLAPLQGLFRWFAGGVPPSRCTVQAAGLRGCKIENKTRGINPSKDNINSIVIIKTIATYPISTRAKGINYVKIRAVTPFRSQPPSPVTPHLPHSQYSHPPQGSQHSRSSTVLQASPVLRVMRVLEAGQARACVGRMVISGRMADVCAELDRLAAREAALH